MNAKKVSLAPTVKIFALFKRFPYTVSSAICEFIDNSIASYDNNRNILVQHFSSQKLKINIIYDTTSHFANDYKIIIEDNAFGMNYEEFCLSLVLQNEPKIKTSLNEYGTGMKTATAWFGNFWKIESSQFGSQQKFYAFLNLENFEKGNAFVEVLNENEEVDKHYTVITISKLSYRITKKGLEEVAKKVQNIYQTWLKNYDIEIRICERKNLKYIENKNQQEFDDIKSIEFLKPEEKAIWLDEEEGKHYKWELRDFIHDNDKKYLFSGFVAINQKIMSQPGIYFFLKNRLIEIYYPSFFGPGNPRRRIFAELELEGDWHPSQGKDKLIWNNDVEQKFLEKLKIFFQKNKIFKIASNVINNDKPLDIKEVVQSLQKNLKKRSVNLDHFNSSFTEIKKIDKNKLIIKSSNLDPIIIELENTETPKNLFNITTTVNNHWLLTIHLKHKFFLKFKKKMNLKLVDLISTIFIAFGESIIRFHRKDKELIPEVVQFVNQYLS